VIEDRSPSTSEALQARVAELEAALTSERSRAEAALAAERARADEAIAERDRLRDAYRHLQLEVELTRRRLVVAKAERIDTQQLELEFAAKLRELDLLAGRMPGADDPATEDPDGQTTGKTRKSKKRPTGRRNSPTSTCPRSASSSSIPRSKAQRSASAPRIATS
jgi:hypothetical protein